MKALTLHQPWATLVAYGIKTIETRSWSTRHRGPLAIHAAVTPEHLTAHVGAGPCHGVSLAAATVPGSGDVLPLGSVVTIVDLDDVLPIVDLSTTPGRPWPSPDHRPHDHPQVERLQPDILVVCAGLSGGYRVHYVDGQLRHGDFGSGRYAWMLTDNRPLREPVPARGRQGLWDWTPPEGLHHCIYCCECEACTRDRERITR